MPIPDSPKLMFTIFALGFVVFGLIIWSSISTKDSSQAFEIGGVGSTNTVLGDMDVENKQAQPIRFGDLLKK